MTTPLSAREQAAALRRVVERCRHQPGEPRPRVVFDLDGTLLDNRPRTAAILRELIALWPEAAAAKLRQLGVEQIRYDMADTFAQLGLEDERLLAAARRHWQERFFYDQTLHHDQPLPGAVAFARACWEAGAALSYFTGRDLPNMALGTFASLRDHGFPIGLPGTELVLKPHVSQSDAAFKREALPALTRASRVVAAFENEPGNCNLFVELAPEAQVFFLQTLHSRGAPPLLPQVQTLRDYRLESA